MNHHEREIRIYQTRDGRFPFSEWFERLRDQKSKQVIDSRLARVRLGNLGDARSLGAGLYELRIHFGPGFRIYFGLAGTRIVLLLCGGDKSSQERDIQQAKKYWSDAKNQNL